MMINKPIMAVVWCGILVSMAWADQIQLSGTIRDFKRGDWESGHPDFETVGSVPGHGGYGHVLGLVSMRLGDDGKPAYNPQRPSNDVITSAESLSQWFNDVPGVNLSTPLTITLDNNRDEPGGVYSYSTNAFWPIDGQLFGNQNLPKNFHFTYELHTKFTYTPSQEFVFTGDDDVWVYVNGVRMIDIGGVHTAVSGKFMLFDGKAFVTNSQFPLGGMVKKVGDEMEDRLKRRWHKLDLPGSCPIQENDRYIDLDLNQGGHDTRCQFNGTSVTAYAATRLTRAVLKFADGMSQAFDNLSDSQATLRGSGPHTDKVVVGCWVTAHGSQEAQYHSKNGATSIDCSLDFFFAERHTTQSNFRIDTSILLEPVEPETISPLYD